VLRGQTNFVKMLWKFHGVYNPALQLSDHAQPVRYEMALPRSHTDAVTPPLLYIHTARGRQGRHIDEATERFVDGTRVGHGA
jgi:hypothetical protein